MKFKYILPAGSIYYTKREVQKAVGHGSKAVNNLIRKGIIKREALPNA